LSDHPAIPDLVVKAAAAGKQGPTEVSLHNLKKHLLKMNRFLFWIK
jgi:hypothetical protein